MTKTLARMMALCVAVVMALSGCSVEGDDEISIQKNTSGHIDDDDDDIDNLPEIVLLNGKTEIKDQMLMLSEAYTEETGNKITIVSIGGDKPAGDKLKKMEADNNMPDIFVCQANEFTQWDNRIIDLSDESWNDFTDLAYVNDEGKVLGFPYMVEACGITYNEDVLNVANIDPETLTTPKAYKQAFEILDAKKEELGLKAVVAYGTNPKQLGWSTGSHIFGQYLDAGLAPDDKYYLNDPQSDLKRLKHFATFIGMLNKYSDQNLLLEGSYEDQVKGFAQGDYAFITQGSWIGALLTGKFISEYHSADRFEVGIAPFAFEEGADTILDGPTSYWAVYDGPNADLAKKFLSWCTKNEAQRIFVDEAGLVSPFKNCPYEPVDPFASEVIEWLENGKRSSYHTFIKPPKMSDELAEAFYEYAKGDIKNADEFVNEIVDICDSN